MNHPKIVSRDEWFVARKELLAKEKAHTRERDEISRQRRELPWVRVEKEYGRGGEEFLGAYKYLDMTPKGRDENGPYKTLADWVRPKNLYGKGGMVEANGRYHLGGCSCAAHESATS
jgi:predicted dithiol-disulfide oxidoreductase (DUF899 family)